MNCKRTTMFEKKYTFNQLLQQYSQNVVVQYAIFMFINCSNLLAMFQNTNCHRGYVINTLVCVLFLIEEYCKLCDKTKNKYIIKTKKLFFY